MPPRPTPPLSPNIVPLFADQAASDDDPDAPSADWLGALQMIRDVGAQVRRERDLAQEIVHHSQSLIQRSQAQAEDSERRADAAEAEASDALRRADRAEERARLAEDRAQEAEQRAQAAQASATEARLWLRRLHAGLKSEFDSLTTEPK
ncbi:MAG TPA: hypothetical protein VF641_08005 [Methylobacterium sp.]|jgi:hypothetical protein